jgi:broad specificity phosphatase PhoE
LSDIVLIRHGPVALKATGLLSFQAFARHIAAYELAGVSPEATPPAPLVTRVRRAETVFASDAVRVIDTLSRLGVTADFFDSAFREAPPDAPALPLLLPEIGWLALARARGAFSPALSEARADLRRRAQASAERLIGAAAQGDVALIGHGWFNRAVAGALAERGWRRIDGPGFGRPWGFASFRAQA